MKINQKQKKVLENNNKNSPPIKKEKIHKNKISHTNNVLKTSGNFEVVH